MAISESVRLQQVLATYGIQTQTPKQIEPLLIWSPSELVKVGLVDLPAGRGSNPSQAYTNLGINKKLGFSGRPARPVGVLGTCKVRQRKAR